MELLGGLIIVVGFISLVKLFGLIERNIEVIRISKSAVSIVNDKQLDDYQKEKMMQKHAKDLLPLFFLIITISILAIGIPLGLVWLMDYVGLLSFNKVIGYITSIEFILASVVISTVVFVVTRKKK
ncbi:MAG: hypothetical protein KAR20_00325 [Candidatus Heimdallarchaeota archaeon]|nr:hypothetical protein [Candidatus Heimdallarchaeota archaeon]